jgi:hypothetical protein
MKKSKNEMAKKVFGKLFVSGVLVVFAAVLSLIILKHFSSPYIWMALIWVITFLSAWVLIPRSKPLWIGLVILTGGLGSIEGWFWIADRWVIKDVSSEGTFNWVSHDILGYVAAKGVSQTEAKYYRGEKIYDVIYTMDANGLRISPPYSPPAKGNKRCMLFFGDSYTFGWGLSDQDTMPYRVGIKAAPKYGVYNLAFLTHGPHQLLATIEHNLVSKAVSCAPNEIKYIIYQTTPDHVRRAAGLRDKVDLHHGPQYALTTDGQLIYQGQIGDDVSAKRKIVRTLSKSSLYRKMVGGNVLYTRAYSDDDLALYLAIVDSVGTRLKTAYPKSEFHILFWGTDSLDKKGKLAEAMINGLNKKGLTIHRINDILPGADQYKEEFFLGGFDLHPNPAANDRIADYVVRKILK